MTKSNKNTLLDAYLTSLTLALQRDLTTDTFVLKRSMAYLINAIKAIHEIEPKFSRVMLEKLEEFLSSERNTELQLEALFAENGKKNYVYNFNMNQLFRFRDTLHELLGIKKGGPEASKCPESDDSGDRILEDEAGATLSVLTHADELEATLD